MLRTGIISSLYFSFNNYKEGLETMREDNFDCCDYHGFIHDGSPLYQYNVEMFTKYMDDLYQSAVHANIEFFQIHAQWPLPCGTEKENSICINRARRCIDGANYLHCPNVVFHTFAPPMIEFANFGEIFSMNVSLFRQIVDYAAKYNVTICIENLPFKKLELSKVDEVLRLIHEVNHPNCKMCFDVGHANIFHDDIAEDIYKSAKELHTLHIHDNMGEIDSHLIPWQGSIDWKRFVYALHKIKYNGCISMEPYINHKMPTPIIAKMRKALSEAAHVLAKELT